MPTSSTGPKPGKSSGRNRNTGRNLYGKTQAAQPFPLSGADTTEFGIQRGNLIFTNRTTQAMLSTQAAMAKIARKSAFGDIAAQKQMGLADVAGEMGDRGMIGSTVNAAATEGVKSEALSAQSAAQSEYMQAIFDVKAGRLSAIQAKRLGLGELRLRKAAAQRELALAAFAGAGVNPYGYSTNVGA